MLLLKKNILKQNTRILLSIFLSFTLLLSILSHIKTVEASSITLGSSVNDIRHSNLYTFGNEQVSIFGSIDQIVDCKAKRAKTPGQDDRIYNSADIYILNSLPVNDMKMTDVSDKPNTIVLLADIAFEDETIGFIAPASNIKDKKSYFVVMDNCQNEFYDSNSDVIFKSANEEMFKVDIDLSFFGTGGLDSETIEDIKSSASRMETEANILDAAAQIFVSSLAVALIKALIPTCVGKASLAACIAGGWAIEKGLDVVANLKIKPAENLAKKYEGLAANPPNIDFKNLSQLKNINNFYPHIISNNFTFSDSLQLISQLDNEASLIDAFLNSLEKYQGALIFQNPKWVVIHLQQLIDFAKHLLNQTIITDNAFSSERNSLKLEGNLLDNLKHQQNQIKLNGFNLTEIKNLMNLGFDNDQIKDLEQTIVSSNFSLLLDNEGIRLSPNSDAIINVHQDLRNNLTDIISEAETAIDLLKAELPFVSFDFPIANSGGPYFGQTNVPILLNGSASQANFEGGNITKYEWDLNGDGLFDEGNRQVFETTFVIPVEGYIGLRVTDNSGYSDIDYSSINITNSNHLPALTNFSPSNLTTALFVNSSQLFEIGVSDIEGDNIIREWFLDDRSVASDTNSIVYTPTTEDIGAHLLTVNITDSTPSSGTLTHSWFITVQSVDNDNDGWRANVDCNENDPEINPGIKEIFNNDIDDDCNVSTPDFNASPIVINNNNIFLVEPNNSTDLPLSANDLNGDPLTFNILRGPIHGSIGNIIPFNSTLSFVHYVADAGFIGNDSLIFNVNDGKVNSTNIGNIKIRVGSDNSPPVSFSQQLFMRGSGPIVTDRNLPIHLESFDQENDPLTFEILDSPQQGTLSGTFPNLVYTPNRPVTSDHDSFTFRANDGELNGNIAKILITFTQNIPNPQSILLHHIADVPLPVGITHHPLFNKLVVSVNEPTGLPNNLEIINDDGSHNKYTNTSGLTDELKLASVRDTLGGFEVGEIFTGNGKPGEIIRISPDGSSVQDPWVVLPGETGIFRGGLHVDETGVYDGDLIAVTTVGNVWRINSDGEPTFLARAQSPIGGPVGPIHLEGVTTVPDIPEKYGPWAGKIVAGAEDLNGFFYIDTEGNISIHFPCYKRYWFST